ncbi:MAG: VOC family protein [Cyanothece sp. SIO1E1]|nr:VOC family protein [Cyanothece sp. SIO1E1]
MSSFSTQFFSRTLGLLTLSLGLFACTTGAPEAETGGETDTTSSSMQSSTKADEGVLFKRATILVADIDRSLEIYRDILGFEVFQISESSEDSYSYPVFKIPKEAKIRFATLSSPTQVRTLALTEVTGVELPKPSAPLMTAGVIKVDDLPAVMEKIEALGLEITEPKVDEGTDFTFREQAFIDFDGHLMVLYQILPGQ